MGEFSVSYNASFEQQLQPNANYIFIVSTKNNITETSGTNNTDTRPSCNCSKYIVTYLVYVRTYVLICIFVTWHEKTAQSTLWHIAIGHSYLLETCVKLRT